jgi:hypothetical protein
MQDVLAILIAVVAALYLVRRTWLRVVRGKRGACGMCPGCAPVQSIRRHPLVPLDQLQSSAAVSQRNAAKQDP